MGFFDFIFAMFGLEDEDYEDDLGPYPGETWVCEACGKRRPDAQISVVKQTTSFPGGGSVERNVKYCNDKPECFERAVKIGQEYIDGTR